MEYWVIDIAAIVLMVLTGYLVYLLETNRIGRTGSETTERGLPSDDDWRPHFLYPARLIRQAGFRSEQSFLLYWAAKFALAVMMPLLLLEFLRGEAPGWMLVTVALVASFIPEVWLLRRRSKRRWEISHSLVFFIHLIVVYLRSGMSLSQAITMAATYGLEERDPLAEEVKLLTGEIEAGRERTQAFDTLAARTGVEDLKRLAAVVSIGYRAGSPIIDTLKSQAELLKSRQAQSVSELVNRKTMEAMLPMLLICFPVFIVLVLFPAVLQVFDVLRMIGELF